MDAFLLLWVYIVYAMIMISPFILAYILICFGAAGLRKLKLSLDQTIASETKQKPY